MTLRTFIAVDIGALDELVKLEEELEAIGANLKLVEPKNIHLTLKFLGDTADDQVEEIIRIIEECVKDIKPFTLELTGTGAFPKLHYMKVIWVGVNDHGILGPVAKNLDSELTSLGFKSENRDFSPHITVARVKSPKNKKQLKELVLKYKDKTFQKLQIDNIRLKKSILDSKGPTYYTLGEINLG